MRKTCPGVRPSRLLPTGQGNNRPLWGALSHLVSVSVTQFKLVWSSLVPCLFLRQFFANGPQLFKPMDVWGNV